MVLWLFFFFFLKSTYLSEIHTEILQMKGYDVWDLIRNKKKMRTSGT